MYIITTIEKGSHYQKPWYISKIPYN